MKQLYNSKRILAFILTFIMIVSNIKLIPVFATGESGINETVLYSENFENETVTAGTKIGTQYDPLLPKGTEANVVAQISQDENAQNKYLHFLAKSNGTGSSRRAYANINNLKGTDNFIIEMDVMTTEGVSALIGLANKGGHNSSESQNTVSWKGDTGGTWQAVKIECSVAENGTITSTAYVKNGDGYDVIEAWKERTLKSKVSDEQIVLVLKPESLENEATEVCFDDIKVYYTEEAIDSTVAATSVIINGGAESVDVEAGKTATLTAAVTPENATDKTVVWRSDNSDVATVDAATGVVTGVSAGSATITATVGKNVTDTITVNVIPEYVAQIGNDKYETLQGAIDVAGTGDTITLLGDVDLGETDIMLSYGTLDLNGQILTASSLVAFTGTNVVDNSENKTGVLKATFVLAETNTQMPIHNGTGYVFIDFNDIKKQEKDNTVANSGVFDLIFRPSFGETNNASLAALGDAAQVSFRIRLKWTGENGENEQTKDLYYSDDLVKQVYDDKKAFSITASGISNYHNLTITPLVQSKLNAKIEWLGSTYTANQ